MPDYTPEFVDRFWSKVAVLDDPDACWLWKASTKGKGYGQIYSNHRLLSAHRVSFELAHGDPGDLHVLHSCDNPLCVNPKHLFLGTNTDNIQDMVNKGRNARGERHGAHKLTESQVAEIRRRFAAGERNKTELGRLFGVSDSLIHQILTNKKWRYGGK